MKTTRQHFIVVSIVILLVGIASVMVQMKPPTIITSVAERFSLDNGQISLFMSMFTFVGLILALPVGFAAKRFGPKPMLLAAVGIVALGAAIGVLAGGPAMLVASRAVEGVAYIIIITCGPLAIERYVAPERLGTAMGIWSAYGVGGTLIANMVTPTLYATFGFAGVWTAYAVFAVFAGVLLLVIVRDTPHGAVRAADAVLEDPRAALAEDAADAASAHGAEDGGASASDEAEGDSPEVAGDPQKRQLGYRAFFSRDLILFFLCYVMYNVLVAVTLSFAPTFMQSQGMTSAQSGLVMMVPSGIALFALPFIGTLIDRFGRCKPIFLITMAAMIPAGFLLTTTVGPGMWVGLLCLGFLGMGVSSVCPTAFVRILDNPALLGVGMGMLKLMQCLGQTIGNYGVPMLLGPGMSNWTAVAIASLAVGAVGWASIALCRFK